jgi:hypothetical protein
MMYSCGKHVKLCVETADPAMRRDKASVFQLSRRFGLLLIFVKQLQSRALFAESRLIGIFHIFRNKYSRSTIRKNIKYKILTTLRIETRDHGRFNSA